MPQRSALARPEWQASKDGVRLRERGSDAVAVQGQEPCVVDGPLVKSDAILDQVLLEGLVAALQSQMGHAGGTSA